MTASSPRATPTPPREAPANGVDTGAPARPSASPAPHAVGDAAQQGLGTGQASGTDTASSSDWMAERVAPAKPEAGVPVDTSAGQAAARGQATESKRGAI
jgi:hypothetical protein